LVGPWQQRNVGGKLRADGHKIGKGEGALRRSNSFLALGPSNGMSDFDQEDVRSNKFYEAVAEVIPQLQGLVGVQLGDDPFETYGRIEDALHARSRSSRIAGTPMFRTPCFCWISARKRSIRSQACRTMSGLRTPSATRRAASRSSS